MLDRDLIAEVVISRLGARRSAWNAADIRGEAERLIAAAGVIAGPVGHDATGTSTPRTELADDITARALDRCRPLLARGDVPEHVRALTSEEVLVVESELNTRLAVRAEHPAAPFLPRRLRTGGGLDEGQRRVVGAILGFGPLLVVEGAAGAGKTTTLATVHGHLESQGQRLVVVTPTLKAAHAAQQQVGSEAFSAAWLIYQHGFRWDEDGHWTRHPATPAAPARMRPGDVLLVDEAGMLDQDTARALLTIADEARARLVLMGDRHQLPAVGRGGVLDLAARWAPPEACLELDSVHRFTDPAYTDLSLFMRTGEASGEVFDALVRRGEIVVHATDVERTAALTAVDGLVIADTREQVTTLNAVIRDRRITSGEPRGEPRGGRGGERGGERRGERGSERHTELVTRHGEPIGIGDRVATRRNDRDLGVANRDTWTVTSLDPDGGLTVTGRPGERTLPAGYVREHVELAYATTVYGAQGDTVDRAHFVVGDTTGAAAAYVAMTRGRHTNVAHLVAEDLDDARRQWVEVFARDRADLGPGHAASLAADDIDRYGPRAPARPAIRPPGTYPTPTPPTRRPEEMYPSRSPSGGITP